MWYTQHIPVNEGRCENFYMTLKRRNYRRSRSYKWTWLFQSASHSNKIFSLSFSRKALIFLHRVFPSSTFNQKYLPQFTNFNVSYISWLRITNISAIQSTIWLSLHLVRVHKKWKTSWKMGQGMGERRRKEEQIRWSCSVSTSEGNTPRILSVPNPPRSRFTRLCQQQCGCCRLSLVLHQSSTSAALNFILGYSFLLTLRLSFHNPA